MPIIKSLAVSAANKWLGISKNNQRVTIRRGYFYIRNYPVVAGKAAYRDFSGEFLVMRTKLG